MIDIRGLEDSLVTIHSRNYLRFLAFLLYAAYLSSTDNFAGFGLIDFRYDLPLR